MLRWTEGNSACKPHPAYRWWTDTCMACLTRAHIDAAGQPVARTAAYAGRPVNRVPAANRDLSRRLDAHLLVICPNDSGSSFLLRALEA